MSNEEMLEAFDSEGNSLGVMSRSDAEDKNHMTKNVLVFLFNSNKEVWVQLRPMTKKHYPGLWDITACGGLTDGEDPSEAAARELEEETEISDVELEHVTTFVNVFPGEKGEERRRMSSLYVGFTDEKPKAVAGETDEFRKYNADTLLEIIFKKKDAYIPSFDVELKLAIDYVKQKTETGS